MKKLSSLLAGVLICTLASANGTTLPVSSTSSVAVTNSTGSSLFKLYYKSSKSQNVKISVVDNHGKSIFNETIRKVDGFIRPYNFEGSPEGLYTIIIEDESGKMIEKVSYKSGKVEALVNVLRLAGEQNKYMLTIASPAKDVVSINIFDDKENLIHSETKEINGGFAQVYNLKEVKSFTIQITDSNGTLKSVKY
jgi:hypothetical protein